jgi:hypothetical protein
MSNSGVTALVAATSTVAILAAFWMGSLWSINQDGGLCARRHHEGLARLKAQLDECYAEGNTTKALLNESHTSANTNRALLQNCSADVYETKARLKETEAYITSWFHDSARALLVVLAGVTIAGLGLVCLLKDFDTHIASLADKVKDLLPKQPKSKHRKKKKPVPNPGEPQHGQLPAGVLPDQSQ